MLKIFLFLIITSQIFMLDASLLLKEMRKEGRTALVIGNSSYKEVPLKNPVNDARSMKLFLESRGFDVVYGEDASRNGMYDLFDEYIRKVNKNGGVALFYFAGHGVGYHGENFLIPVDARIKKPRDIKRNAFGVNTVLDEIANQGTRLNIVILDACRNNPFKGSRAAGGGLAGINSNARGTFIAYSTAPGKTASDGDGENSIYTKHLLLNMKKTGLPIEQVFKKVRVGVENDTNSVQRPWETSSLNGDFFFTLPQEKKTVENKKTTLNKTLGAKEAWGLISTSSSIIAYVNFISLYPQSSFAILAKQKINELQNSTRAGNNSINDDRYFWEDVKDSENIASYQAYLNKFPNGVYKALAELKIAKLKEANKQFELYITTKPEGGIITFVDKPYTYTSGMLLDKGKYKLIIQKKGFENYNYTVILDRNLKLTVPLNVVKKIYPIHIRKKVYASYIEPELQFVNSGKFIIGDSSNISDKDEKVTKEISFSYGFYMGVYEVTLAEYDKYSDAKKLVRVRDDIYERETTPVTKVSWNDAVGYAKWLSQETGKAYRLPTEAEWEYVARAGSKSTFYWGNNSEAVDEFAVHKGNTYYVSEVGTKKPNNWEFYDMAGNVWEWCQDSYVKSYADLPDNGSANPAISNKKVIRGGAWNTKVSLLRTSNRLYNKKTKKRNSIGFRLVMVP